MLAIAVASAVVAVVASVSLHLAYELRPGIGDIIAFAGKSGWPEVQARITALRSNAAPGLPCVLDPHVMKQFGGSLLIEAARSQPTVAFDVHWAGTHTSDGVGDCGASADLVLNLGDVVTLTLAAGRSG